jgi:dolichyl-diphosphooligosaccharide--protein glycosyltransferase/undecaprenyl-diphosphooligosaccharide--protein glycosyltransferase
MVVLGFFALQGGLRFTVFAVPFMALGIAYLILLVAYYIKNIFAEKIEPYAYYAVSLILISLVLYPNITHIQGYKVPVVFNKDEVKILDKLKSVASREDYVITWWDYGYPIRYYSDVKTLVDGGKHSGSVNFPVSFALCENQIASANMARLNVEYTELAFNPKNFIDRNGSSHTKLAMQDYGFKNAYKFLLALNNKDFKLPKKTRDIYFYLPHRMLNIYPTVALFSNLDLNSGQQRARPFFYKTQSIKETQKTIELGNNIRLFKQGGLIQIGQQKLPLNSLVITQYNNKGQLIKKVQKINNNSSISAIFMKSYNTFLVVDMKIFNSLYIQLFVLENFDKDLFQPVILSPLAKVYKLKI